ncbi:MAG: hypothetical protein AAFX80_18000 [Cyanobacteria bacterium J06639_18]
MTESCHNVDKESCEVGTYDIESVRRIVADIAKKEKLGDYRAWNKFVELNGLPDGVPADLRAVFGGRAKSFPQFTGVKIGLGVDKKVKTVKLLIDGGRSNCKVLINGEFMTFTSEAWMCDAEDVEIGRNGSFIFDSDGYYVGSDGDSIPSAIPYLLEDESKLKVECFPLYVLSALSRILTSQRKADVLEVGITCVAIANQREIAKTLEDYTSFVCKGNEYQLDLKIESRKPEGYGACLVAATIAKQSGIERGYICDIGGGTIQILETTFKGKEPAIEGSKVFGASGMNSLKSTLAKKFGRLDISLLEGYTIEAIEDIFHEATVDNDDYKATSSEFPDYCFGKALGAAMSIWAAKNVTVKSAFVEISGLLKKNNHVYLTGGAFAIKAFKHFFLNHNLFKRYAKNLHALPEPERINLTGLEKSTLKRLLSDARSANQKLTALPPKNEESAA